MTDEKIIELYFERDEKAVSMSQESYGAYCLSIGNEILQSNEDAEECVNETWLRAWNIIPPQKPRKLSTFFGRITRNIAFDKYREKHSQKRGKGLMAVVLDELDECIPDSFDTDKHIDNSELKQILDEFLESLSQKDSVIFLARYWYAKSLHDISRKYKINENTVKASLFRSRNKLRECLAKADITV